MMLIVGATPFLPVSIVLILAASSPLILVSLVGAIATRFPVPVLLGVLCTEVVNSLAVIAWSGHSLERRAALAVVRIESRCRKTEVWGPFRTSLQEIASAMARRQLVL